jgi:hypothetical protein
MARKLILALASTAALMCAGAAHAGSVNWSVGINLPGIGTVISNAPIYVPTPVVVYQEPAPVVYQRPVPVYAPAPVVYPQPPVAYPPRLIYYPVPRAFAPVPQQVVYGRPAPQWGGHGHDRDGGRWHREQRRWHHDQRDERGQRDQRGPGDHRDEYGDRFNNR